MEMIYNIKIRGKVLNLRSYYKNTGINVKEIKNTLSNSIAIIIMIVISLMVIGCSYAENVYIKTPISGVSMQPTINESAGNDTTNNYDIAFVNTFQKGVRGDIIVAYNGEKSVIKRLIAVSGDTLTFDNSDSSQTKIYVNGELLIEDYINHENNGIIFSGLSSVALINFADYITVNSGEIQTITIPNGYVFYMGDNRNSSSDCRLDGPRLASSIIGRVDYIYTPSQNADDYYFERLKSGWNELFNYIFGKVF